MDQPRKSRFDELRIPLLSQLIKLLDLFGVLIGKVILFADVLFKIVQLRSGSFPLDNQLIIALAYGMRSAAEFSQVNRRSPCFLPPQAEVIKTILRHCGQWLATRAPPGDN